MRPIDADVLVQMYEELKDRYKDGICFEVLDSIIKDINNTPTIEPNGDLISREEAIEAFDRGRLYHKSGIEEIINTLPSADTKRVLQGYCKGANCKWWNQQVNGCNRCVMIQDEYKHTSADRQKGEVEEDDE